MKKLLLLLAILPLMISCQNSNYKYSDTETEQFLNEITKNAKISITDITEIKKQPTDLCGLLTRYSISKKQLNEFNKNRGTIVNKDDDISDFATYTFKNYELSNEKNEKLKFVDNGRAIYLQEYGLWDYNNVLCQNLGIEIKLDKKFEKLNGHISIEFEMPNGMEKEIKIPVNITINDKVPE
jgi:hypothetical protein